MPALDLYHESVRKALIKEGWTITAEPLALSIHETSLLIDIAAERVLTAERGGERIAVEVKSFVSLSPVQDLKEATGQFLLYELALKRSTAESDRTLFLAVREAVFNALFVDGIGQMFLDEHTVRLLVFDPDAEEVVQWIR